MLTLLIGLCALGGGAFIALQQLTVRSRQVQASVTRAAAAAAAPGHPGASSARASDRLMRPLLQRFSNLAMRMSPASKRADLEWKLRCAGSSVRPQTLLAVKGLLSSVGIVLLLAGMFSASMPLLGVGTACFVAGFLGPDRWLATRIASRRLEMERAMPDTLDLLTVSVEAGLAFDAAVAKACEKLRGPLVDELRSVAREIRVGETRRQALRNLGERVASDDVRSFTRAIIQADELGSSLGRTLKVQADDMRVRRQLAAEEQAMKAPVKMLFPTVLFIFPAMFIVILGPAMLNIMDALSAGG